MLFAQFNKFQHTRWRGFAIRVIAESNTISLPQIQVNLFLS